MWAMYTFITGKEEVCAAVIATVTVGFLTLSFAYSCVASVAACAFRTTFRRVARGLQMVHIALGVPAYIGSKRRLLLMFWKTEEARD